MENLTRFALFTDNRSKIQTWDSYKIDFNIATSKSKNIKLYAQYEVTNLHWTRRSGTDNLFDLESAREGNASSAKWLICIVLKPNVDAIYVKEMSPIRCNLQSFSRETRSSKRRIQRKIFLCFPQLCIGLPGLIRPPPRRVLQALFPPASVFPATLLAAGKGEIRRTRSVSIRAGQWKRN